MDAKNRTEAEIYRQERKERIKKDAAKRTKGTGKAGQVVSKVISIVICAAIICGACWFFADFFGIPQKLTAAATVTVDGKEEKVSVAEFNYYYVSEYLSTANLAYTYSQYGLTAGYDFNKSAEEQTTTDDDGNEVTYAEYFKLEALESIERVHNLSAKAKAAGLTLTDAQQAEIDESLSSLKERAETSKMSLSAYIINMYGKGLNEKLFRGYLQDQYLADSYTDSIKDAYAESATADEIEEKYAQSPETYQSVDLRVYGFTLAADTSDDEEAADTVTYTADEQRARANEMISRVTDEASFKSLILEYCTDEEKEDIGSEDRDASLARGMAYDAIQSNMGEEAAQWAFSTDRQNGDTTVWETDSYVYAVYLVNPAYQNEKPYVSVRHLLVSFPEEETTADDITIVDEPVTGVDGEAVETEDAEAAEPAVDENGKRTPKTNEEAKEIAEYYLAMYNGGERTEDAFAELADTYSDDTASTSSGSGSGGLIENMTPGQYVKPFEDWAFDPARLPGDVGIVETSYGYHIVYFVEADEYPA